MNSTQSYAPRDLRAPQCGPQITKKKAEYYY